MIMIKPCGVKIYGNKVGLSCKTETALLFQSVHTSLVCIWSYELTSIDNFTGKVHRKAASTVLERWCIFNKNARLPLKYSDFNNVITECVVLDSKQSFQIRQLPNEFGTTHRVPNQWETGKLFVLVLSLWLRVLNVPLLVWTLYNQFAPLWY